MARDSRPPGFDMTYKPTDSVAFGVPLREHLPSLLYLLVAVASTVTVAIAWTSHARGWLFRYVVEGDADRLVGSRWLVVFLLLGAVASLVRTRMRGVVVHAEGIEARDLWGASFPRVRKFAWAQIDRLVLDGERAVALDLWDGTRAFLPDVAERERLASALVTVARARAIPIAGLAPGDDA